MRRLLDYAPMAGAKLDAIEEEQIEALKRQRTRQVSRLASRWLSRRSIGSSPRFAGCFVSRKSGK
jgi:hypothetical protein